MKFRRKTWFLGLSAIASVVVVAMGVMAAAGSSVAPTALSAQPKGVSVIPAHETTYRPTRRYLGTLQPWQEAKIGPQLVSAYIATVLVRPGDLVEQGQVVATLDCRSTTANSQSIAMKARALDAQQRAIASESARTQTLVADGFVSKNEAEQKEARSLAAQAQVQAMRAELAGRALEVNDCVLKAPFAGEVSRRFLDPGSFVRPSAILVSIVDRTIVRVAFAVPEIDYKFVAPGTEARLRTLATGQEFVGKIARRSPSANPETRTVRVDIDVPDPQRTLPVGTTAEVFINVGEPQKSLELPMRAATVRGSNATIFVVKEDVAQSIKAKVLGESSKSIFIEPSIEAGAFVVVEGRAKLRNGDIVRAQVQGGAAPVPASSTIPAGGKP